MQELELERAPQTLRQSAKHELAAALGPVSEDLEALRPKLLEFIPSESETSAAILHHVFEARGKQIRPALFFLCSRLFDYRGDQYFPIGAVCEYVHTASLLHDDVIDNSSLRRNKPTANRVWGDEASVLVGDLIYARASELMAATGSIEIVRTFARAIRKMSEGELLQLEQLFNLSSPQKAYFDVIECKTAVLIGASCKAAGILGNADSDKIEALHSFGMNLGIAFQLVDDSLDYIGSREFFGKQPLSDLKEGKVTLPILFLREEAEPEELEQLAAIVAGETITTDQLHIVASLVEKYDTTSKTIQLAETYTNRALMALSVLPNCEARANLEELANRLVWRFFLRSSHHGQEKIRV